MLICFCGYATSGKTEAAKGLPGFVRTSFADALKDEVASDLRITRAELDANKEQYRNELVKLGASRRAEEPDYWVNIVLEELRDGVPTVVDDLRYENEARHMKLRGGHIIYIDRPGVGPANAEEKRSIQEILDKKLFDSVLHNDGTIEQLHARAARLVAFYKELEIEQ
jgi:hypothetical protein